MEHTKHPPLSSTDLYANYIWEREKKNILTTEHGFIVYGVMEGNCHIYECYVLPEKRRSRIGWLMADRVTEIAKINGCTSLTACVVPSLHGASESMAAQLAYGFKVKIAQTDCIVLSKEI